jgi:hypothetical protein
MVDGVFHDACEVYAILDGKRTWVATFATRALAADYVTRVKHDDRPSLFPYQRLEVVPV